MGVNNQNKFSNLVRKGVKVGFFHLLSANILLQIAGFGGQIFLTRVLSVEDIGRIRILQSFLGILIMVATIGINTTVLKLCSEKINNKDRQAIFLNSMLLSLCTSLLVVFIIYIFATFNLLSSDNIINNALKIYILQIPFLVLSSIGFSYLQSQKKIKIMSKIQSVSKIVVISFSTIIAFIYGFYGYVYGILCSTILTSGLLYIILKPEINLRDKFKVNKQILQKVFTFGGYALGTGVCWQLILNANVILADYIVKDTSAIAYYGTAQLIINTLMMVPITLNQLMIPYISEESHDYRKVKKIMVSYQKRMYMLMIVVITGGYVFLPFLVPFAFGSEYTQSIPYLFILLAGLFFWSVYSPKNNILTSIGNFKYTFYVNLLSLIFNLIISYLLMIHIGVIGAAIANTMTFLFGIFVNRYFFNKALNS
ncbi:glycosyltransferase [Bacillus cereus]|uniref:flippase n=1 Tax=Bacillus cereus TaxID=1396 RepID=UPI000BF9CC6A|nr:flippase [Bacillus cereus]PER02692.1 glycosyltransferase [Bacillus cereus]PFA01159.1 glycosyltransferase [Bacillus cereus]PGU04372.1 glycosyltransferase [Bacillus cereus]